MSSGALDRLNDRLRDIDQLLEAHTAITKFKKAETAAQHAGGELAKLTEVIGALVSDPGPGKRKEVDAINRASFVLSIAHFQGFIDDLHEESGNLLLAGKVTNTAAVIKLVKPPRSNPHVDIIDRMFAGLGIYELMDDISWQKCTNQTVKSRLKDYIEVRNKIAHGQRESITKQRVKQLKQFIELLARNIDAQVAVKGRPILGGNLW